MFWPVICNCEKQYYKINYKHERCKCTKTKACCRNISCSCMCNFISFWLNVFHKTNSMNENTSYFLKVWSNKNLSKQRLNWFSVITQFALLTLIFIGCYILNTWFFKRWTMFSPTITRTHEEPKQGDQREMLSSVSPI